MGRLMPCPDCRKLHFCSNPQERNPETELGAPELRPCGACSRCAMHREGCPTIGYEGRLEEAEQANLEADQAVIAEDDELRRLYRERYGREADW